MVYLALSLKFERPRVSRDSSLRIYRSSERCVDSRTFVSLPGCCKIIISEVEIYHCYCDSYMHSCSSTYFQGICVVHTVDPAEVSHQ